MNITLKHVLVMLLLTPRAFVWGSPEVAPGNGLETDSTTPLRLIIEEVSEDAKKIGLTHERIEARVKSIAAKGRDNSSSSGPKGLRSERRWTLFERYCCRRQLHDQHFIRTAVFYRIGDKWFIDIWSTWRTGSTGYTRDGNYILDIVAEKVEVFSNEFLKANGKYPPRYNDRMAKGSSVFRSD